MPWVRKASLKQGASYTRLENGLKVAFYSATWQGQNKNSKVNELISSQGQTYET